MAPPLRLEPGSYTQAAKDICKAAWNISEVAVTLPDHLAAVTTEEIRTALEKALTGTKTELLSVHFDTESVSLVVRQAAGVLLFTDDAFSRFRDGSDYDTRHDRQSPPFLQPWGTTDLRAPWLLPRTLPGELPPPRR
ncbi:MAG TPA: hypothetical protein VIL36_20750 [Acidimicrobiales bacterium]